MILIWIGYEHRQPILYMSLYDIFFRIAYMSLFIFITMLCGIESILRNIPTFKLNVRNILHNIVSPIEHYYGYK